MRSNLRRGGIFHTKSNHRGRAFLLCRTNAATISTIAKPGAMLNRGQKRAKENAALAAEPCSAAECSLDRL